MPPRKIRVDQLIQEYDGFLIDAFGVLVDGQGALPGAQALVERLNQEQRFYLILTNGSARLPEEAAARYQALGLMIPKDRILTSASLLGSYFAKEGLVGKSVAVLGTQSSRLYVEKAGGVVVDPLATDQYDVLVVANQTDYPLLATIDAVLSHIIRRQDEGRPIAMILTNPDLFYPKGPGSFGITSGSIAAVLEQCLDARYGLGQVPRFTRLGKPYAPIFAEAKRLAGNAHIVMIGDQLTTDIAGAARAGIDSALVLSGLTRLSGADFSDGIEPQFILESLVSSVPIAEV